jgi:hypothetical protein
MTVTVIRRTVTGVSATASVGARRSDSHGKDERQPAAAGRSRWRSRGPLRLACVVTLVLLSLTGCGQGGSKDYDIAPIFPLSADKCAKYSGTVEGSGITRHCWVTKEKCQQAAADWRQAMREGHVDDAIGFRCS